MLSGQVLHRATRHSAGAVLLGAAVVLLASSCDAPGRATSPAGKEPTDPHFTAGQGSGPTPYTIPATGIPGEFAEFDKVKRISDRWQVELKNKGGLQVRVRSFSYAAGAYTGWHEHPGPVLITVVEGTLTFFEADHPCTPIVVQAGQGYVDSGTGHIARNLSGAPARDVTVYLVPPGTPTTGLRIDMPAPPGAAACS